MIWFVDIANIHRGEIAIAGTSAVYSDPSNDPAHADTWSADRNIRADLIQWLLVDRRAIELEHLIGIRVLGARIMGELKLGYVHAPVPLVLRKCSIPAEIELAYAELPGLSLKGSSTDEIYAPGIKVDGLLEMGEGFHAAGVVFMSGATIDGEADFGGGHFSHSRGTPRGWGGVWSSFPNNDPALVITYAQFRGPVWMCCGFESQGATLLFNSSFAGDLFFFGSRFVGSKGYALGFEEAEITGDVNFTDASMGINPPHPSEFKGIVDFATAKFGGNMDFTGTRFTGAPSEPHGLYATLTNIKGGMFWRNVALTNDAFLNLGGAQVGYLIDDAQSWPKPGKLNIGGLKYQGLGLPDDVLSRLHWVGLNAPLNPQPYDQLAKFYRSIGSNSQADQVLIARDEMLYSNSDWPNYVWGKLLKITIGYGHQPLRAIVWSMMVVAIGTVMVATGKRAGVIRLTWPETTPPPSGHPTAGLNSLLYSLDVFLPFVNLHQEHYWWPDEAASGECAVLGRRIGIRGSVLRSYLWAQIIAGWLLSAIFLAAVTGLIRND